MNMKASESAAVGLGKTSRPATTGSDLPQAREKLQRALQLERARPGLRQPIAVALREYEATYAKLVTSKFDACVTATTSPIDVMLLLTGSRLSTMWLGEEPPVAAARALLAGQEPPTAEVGERLDRTLRISDALVKIRRELTR